MFHIPVAAIRIAQRHLFHPEGDLPEGDLPDDVSGELDAATEAALDVALAARSDVLNERFRDDILGGGSRRRKVTAFIQLLATDQEIDAGPIDGFWGPQTDHAFDVLERFEETGEFPRSWRDLEVLDVNPNGFPDEVEETLIEVYGDPEGPVDLVSIEAPWPHRLAWDLTQRARALRVHPLVADSASRVLANVLDHYGLEEIERLRLDHYGGSYNKRRKRGGTAWSTHAFGIAFDYDPQRNCLNGNSTQASFAHPDYDAWWRFWEEEGWTSLGRVRNFDWMHVQAAKRFRDPPPEA